MVNYIPKIGDIVWLEFSPQIGHEQSGFRPRLLSAEKFTIEKRDFVRQCRLQAKLKAILLK